jgi:YggT family protein
VIANEAQMLSAFFDLIAMVIQLIIIVIIINAVLSWLFAFDIVSRRNQFAGQVYDFTQKLTNPLLAPIRRFIPTVGNVDLSPMVLVLGLLFIQQVLNRWAAGSFL